ncbi:hypothetical protein B0T19DRAFT_86245 [Cercophora scortea]|uniref:Uncharacterized protein n=1 Tax=Cercophora scortea TaxID=314031 RepID=A0AAE0IUV8_9PEZI|nr:hypothetical protein B0T19DRAFT_86245 [Cercophora scortea]
MDATLNTTERWDDISAEPPPIQLSIGPDMQLALNQPLKLPIVACVPITRRLGEQPSHASNLFAMAVMLDQHMQPLVDGSLAGNRTASPTVVADPHENMWYYFVFPDLVPTSTEAVRIRIILQRMDFAENEHVCLATVSSRPFTVRETVEVTQCVNGFHHPKWSRRRRGLMRRSDLREGERPNNSERGKEGGGDERMTFTRLRELFPWNWMNGESQTFSKTPNNTGQSLQQNHCTTRDTLIISTIIIRVPSRFS